MKKIVVFLLLSFVMIANTVFADSAPPTFSYDVTVAKQEGTTIYMEQYSEADQKYHLIANGKLEYGTTVSLNGNIVSYDNESYASVWSESLITNNGNTYGVIRLKDLKKKTPWKMSDFTFYDYEHEGTILDEDGIEIYEWPSKTEKVIGIIPNKTKIKYKTIWEDYNWGYITYNGIEGWVSIGEVWSINESDTILAKMKGADFLDKDENKIGEIPSGTTIKNFYNANSQTYYYLNYNGTWGYADRNDFALYYNDSAKYKYIVNYDDAILVGTDDEIISVPRDAVLEYSASDGYSFRSGDEYYYASQIYTNYDGKDGWVFQSYYEGDNDEFRQREINRIQKAIEETKTYIQNKKNNPEETEKSNNILNQVTPEIQKNEETNMQQDVINTPTRDKSFSSIQMITICTLSAVAIALLAVIIIIMFNKSFDKKLLIIIVPVTIVIMVLCYVLVKSFDGITITNESANQTLVTEKQIVSGEEKKEEEKPREVVNLKTSYTKNFFNINEYGGIKYSSDGKQFGYSEAYKSTEEQWLYNQEATFNGTVNASSTLAPQGNFSYEANHVVNGNRDNAWIEGVDGFGEGEYVEFTLKNETSGNRKYKEICIVNGYAGTMKKWETNSRVKKLKFYFNDELYANIELFDTITPQYIDITPLRVESKANSVGKFRFEIDEVYEEDYPGVKYSDTAITGIMLGY